MVPNAGLAAEFEARLLPSITQHDILSQDFINNRLWQQDRFSSADAKGRIATRRLGARQSGSENEYEVFISDLKGIVDKVGVFSAFLPALTFMPFCILESSGSTDGQLY